MLLFIVSLSILSMSMGAIFSLFSEYSYIRVLRATSFLRSVLLRSDLTINMIRINRNSKYYCEF